MPELNPNEYDSFDDWASETSSVDDILQRDYNYERNTELLNKALQTKMTPVIDPNDVEEVRVVRWTLPPEDFHIIDPPPLGPAWMAKPPPLKLIRINQLCKRNPTGIQLALPKSIADAKKQVRALRDQLGIVRDDLQKKASQIPGQEGNVLLQ